MKSLGSLHAPIENLAIGRVIEVDGSHVVAEINHDVSELSRVYAGDIYTIGQFGSLIKIHFGRKIIYALVSRLRMKSDLAAERGMAISPSGDERIIEADLIGEAEWVIDEGGAPTLQFERGVTTYPLPQQSIYLTPRAELLAIYGARSESSINIGSHVGSADAPCFADMNELLGKHTAILGSTGAGKSGAVASIIHSIIGKYPEDQEWNPRIVILDPHDEYGSAFPGHRRLSTDEGSLHLPYWLLNLEETISLFIGKTEFSATSQSNIIKNALIKLRMESAVRIGLDPDEITVDSPIPYDIGNPFGLDDFGERDGVKELSGLVGAINEQRPNNRTRKDHEDYGKVIRKIESLMKDGRLGFMMKPWGRGADPLPQVLGQFFSGKEKVRIVDLSGVPNEVAGAASAVIARTLFSMKVWQTDEERRKTPVLLVCEEAHRYVPNRGEAMYEAAQGAIRRIAKEGRKYGLGLLLISQRPSEVEATVLSQCNSWIVLRLSNESDREHVRGILPDSMGGLTKMLSSLRRREAIFVGAAARLPSRVLIRSLEEGQIPRSHDVDFLRGWGNPALDEEQISKVSERWRYQARAN